jgi:maltose alpha-D-glucosyltransferase/alpha-amylase
VFERYDRWLRSGRIEALRIRVHGDFHLGQVLWTGSDFVFIDFEGEPARSVGERRIKRSPLVDVAGMLRSFDYAAEQATRSPSSIKLTSDATVLAPWARAWSRWVGAAFLAEYLAVAAVGGVLPGDAEEARTLLRALVLDKAMYEVRYEMDHRPDWLVTPIRGILDLIEEPI